MPTFKQYKSYNNSYSGASNTVLNQKIPLFKDYVQFRTDQNTYVLIIGKSDNGYDFTDVTVYTVDGSSGTQTLSVSEYDEVTADYDNPYYTYNNYTNDYYSELERHDALANSLIGFTLTGGIAICVLLVLLRRLFSRR